MKNSENKENHDTSILSVSRKWTYVFSTYFSHTWEEYIISKNNSSKRKFTYITLMQNGAIYLPFACTRIVYNWWEPKNKFECAQFVIKKFGWKQKFFPIPLIYSWLFIRRTQAHLTVKRTPSADLCVCSKCQSRWWSQF